VGESARLQVIPLGGLGEFGMNLMLYRFGGQCLVVDAGMMFPGEEHLGVDVVVPDLSFLDDCGRIHGVLLTHGHEDHIGALPYLLARHDVPVWGSPYTLGLVRRRLAEHGLAAERRLRPLDGDGSALRLGPFAVESLPVAHSIPDARLLVLRTPVGTVVHTADFKLDGDFAGSRTDLARLEALGREGVLLLLSDSTNADRPGRTPAEDTVAGGLDSCLAGRTGRVFVTTFASHIERIRAVAAAATRHGRRVCLVGTSLLAHADVAEQLGYLGIPDRARVTPERVMDLPPERALVLASGSQGEPLSAMARLALGRHRQIAVEPGDLVLHCARRIPGSEKSIGRMLNQFLRRGAETITAAEAPIHVSGHAAQEELRRVLDALRPRFFVPLHGEYRQLAAHARLARDAGLEAHRVLIAESGDVIEVDEHTLGRGDRVHAGQVFIDDTSEEVDQTVLRDRRHIADDGIVVAVVAVHRESGLVGGFPEIIARGFAPVAEEGDDALLQRARRLIADTVAEASPEERTDEKQLRARIHADLKRFLRRETQRQPLIIPLIVEL